MDQNRLELKLLGPYAEVADLVARFNNLPEQPKNIAYSQLDLLLAVLQGQHRDVVEIAWHSLHVPFAGVPSQLFKDVYSFIVTHQDFFIDRLFTNEGAGIKNAAVLLSHGNFFTREQRELIDPALIARGGDDLIRYLITTYNGRTLVEHYPHVISQWAFNADPEHASDIISQLAQHDIYLLFEAGCRGLIKHWGSLETQVKLGLAEQKTFHQVVITADVSDDVSLTLDQCGDEILVHNMQQTRPAASHCEWIVRLPHLVNLLPTAKLRELSEQFPESGIVKCIASRLQSGDEFALRRLALFECTAYQEVEPSITLRISIFHLLGNLSQASVSVNDAHRYLVFARRCIAGIMSGTVSESDRLQLKPYFLVYYEKSKLFSIALSHTGNDLLRCYLQNHDDLNGLPYDFVLYAMECGDAESFVKQHMEALTLYLYHAFQTGSGLSESGYRRLGAIFPGNTLHLLIKSMRTILGFDSRKLSADFIRGIYEIRRYDFLKDALLCGMADTFIGRPELLCHNGYIVAVCEESDQVCEEVFDYLFANHLADESVTQFNYQGLTAVYYWEVLSAPIFRQRLSKLQQDSAVQDRLLLMIHNDGLFWSYLVSRNSRDDERMREFIPCFQPTFEAWFEAGGAIDLRVKALIDTYLQTIDSEPAGKDYLEKVRQFCLQMINHAELNWQNELDYELAIKLCMLVKKLPAELSERIYVRMMSCIPEKPRKTELVYKHFKLLESVANAIMFTDNETKLSEQLITFLEPVKCWIRVDPVPENIRVLPWQTEEAAKGIPDWAKAAVKICFCRAQLMATYKYSGKRSTEDYSIKKALYVELLARAKDAEVPELYEPLSALINLADRDLATIKAAEFVKYG